MTKHWMNCGTAARAALALTVTLALAACGGGNDRTKAHVRFVDASTGYNTLSLTLGTTAVGGAIAYGGSSGYIDVSPSDNAASINSTSSATVLSSSTVSINKDSYYTLLAYGKAGALSSLLLTDNNSAADSGKALVRIINTAPDAGSLDVYVTGASDKLEQSTVLQSAATYGTLGSYISITSGIWRLRVTAAGSKTDVRLDVSNLAFDSTSVKTLVLTPGRGGVLVNALLLTQQSDVKVADNPQARVRVVAAVSGAGAVTAKAGSTPLLTGVTAPARTDYVLVGAGTQSLVVTSSTGGATPASGTAALSSIAPAGGGDYTLLVYGGATTPVARLIEDDNTLPTSGAKMRLVHGVNGVGGSLALKVNFLLTADSVAQGGASAYFTQVGSSTARLDVTSSDNLMTPYTSLNNEILATSVYTLFMVGSAATPVGILAPDR